MFLLFKLLNLVKYWFWFVYVLRLQAPNSNYLQCTSYILILILSNYYIGTQLHKYKLPWATSTVWFSQQLLS